MIRSGRVRHVMELARSELSLEADKLADPRMLGSCQTRTFVYWLFKLSKSVAKKSRNAIIAAKHRYDDAADARYRSGQSRRFDRSPPF